MRRGCRASTRTLSSLSSVSPNTQNPEGKCISLLKSITHIRQFNQILGYFFTNGLKNSSFLATKLVDFCNSIHDMHYASLIFRQIHERSSFLWTALIRGFAQNGLHYLSIFSFSEMHCCGICPNHLTFPFVLKSCGSLMSILEGIQVHTHVIKLGFVSDIYDGNGLVDFYVKCKLMEDACLVYDEMPIRDVVSHTSIVSGFCTVGDLCSARSIFNEVEEIDVVLWSAMIAGYAQNGAADEALELFDQMQGWGVRPNTVTMVSVISACAQVGDFERGKWVHDFMVRNGIEMNMIVYTSLLDMCIRGKYVNEAHKVFNQMPQRDVVCWNSLINGYSKNGYAAEALEVFKDMQEVCIEPNGVTFLSILSSCAQLGSLEKGKDIECLVKKAGIESDLSVQTALLDMYMKCGSLTDASRIFSAIYPRDIVAWSAMINGYAMNGHSKEALSLFGHMFKKGVRPNEVTYVGLLTACSHGGLVQEGYQLFYSMMKDFCLPPQMGHYACMVDILGRAGHIEEAKQFIDEMPIEPSSSVWGSLLGACSTHKNIKIGEYAAQNLVELEPSNDRNYVLLSNIYAATSRWEEVQNIRISMKCNGTQKTPGYSWIEVGGKSHEFLVGDKTHPLYTQIYDIVDDLTKQLRLVGNFSPNQEVLADHAN